MGSNYALTYNVDIAMCIDVTGSMRPLLDTVKESALSFYDDLKAAMGEKGKHFDELRVRVIFFRDYLADGKEAMLTSDFFTLPQQAVEFEQLLNSVQPLGGGDDPEDGLEALAYAINSKWTQSSEKKRHIIIVWTDDATHPLGYGRQADNYPSKMAKDFDELTEWWGDRDTSGKMDQYAKRLLIYAPDEPYWSTIADTWDNTLLFVSAAGMGLQELEYKQILVATANSI